MAPVNATEAQAAQAIATLKSAIEAAESGNQAGEDFVVAAAASQGMLDALISIEEYWNRDQNETAMADALWYLVGTAADAIAKARGAA
jgi:hypothetical protein